MNGGREATEIKHFKHVHNLMLGSVEIVEYYDKCRDGCVLPISPPYFCGLECNFFLHKGCAELPKKKQVWLHKCQEELLTLSDYVLRCEICQYLCNGFGYKCNKCDGYVCLRCVSSLNQRPVNCSGHPHPLLFYLEYKGLCHGCREKTVSWAYYCKGCNFALEFKCMTLPTRAQHKCDEKHLLALTYNDDNDYSTTHYCDIWQTKDPSHWFYRCPTCDTSAHVDCVLGSFPFIKPGSIFKKEDEDYPHPPTIVKKMYYYSRCVECLKPCRNLALECSEPRCNYITILPTVGVT
ncbi:C1-like protein [Corchorus olitorius]|uniref:C1-like protein n=1 Tax=Corchorus olitorius TaxID=93759 RepID=A0A1R3IAH0_9ROSI|nr:C1-like protein [Corchorus olitorius]